MAWSERTACSNGHVYTEENTRWRLRKGYKTRECRDCAAMHRAKPENMAKRAAHERAVRATGHGKARELASDLRQYGLSLIGYLHTLYIQRGRCAICREKFNLRWTRKGKLSPHVDHDHNTGEVRGLLCSDCNVGLGMFKEAPWLLQGARTYLESVRGACTL